MKIIELNPYAPAGKHLKDIVAIFDKGGLVVYPTDAGYLSAVYLPTVQQLKNFML
jgi:tRNA A37 threonylcarbamoyladenosine synthetase subunit TsaC/SUA5/YrdC